MERCEIVSKSSMEEILHQNSCAVCQSILRRSYGDLHLGTCRSESAPQIKGREEPRCTAYSTACEALGKQKQQQMVLHREGHHHGESTLNGVKETEERYVKRQNNGEGPQRCFLGSSLYYGGPDELYDILKGRKEGQNGINWPQQIETKVKQLEDAMDPLNSEFTTRGNWWEGSLYY